MTYKSFQRQIKYWLSPGYNRGLHAVPGRARVKLFTALILMISVLPVRAANLQLPTVHKLGPARRVPHPVLATPRPVIVGASYHLAASCTNPLHAITVTVKIRNQGGPLKAKLAQIQISEPGTPHSPIWNANSVSSFVPPMGHGQTYNSQQFVGTVPQYRQDLPGAHTLAIEIHQFMTGNPAAKAFPTSTYRLRVNIPAGYCQNTLRPVSKKISQLESNARGSSTTASASGVGNIQLPHRAKPYYPPSPCKTKECLDTRHGRIEKNKSLAKFGAALKPDLHVVSLKLSPGTVDSGKPIVVTAVIQNKSAIASKAGKILNIYCSGYGNWNTPPTRWTCKVPAQGKSVGGMPMWKIPLPAVPGHGQSDVSLRISEKWPDGVYYFMHSAPGAAVTIQSLVKAKDDGIVLVNGK